MKFAVIAALSLATVSAGTIVNGAACTKVDDCVDKSSCSTVTKGTGNTDGVLAKICITTTLCAGETEVDGSDSKKYKISKDTCMKATTTTEKLAAGKPCKLATDCAEKLKCGGTGEASAYVCVDETTCDKDVDSKKTVCLSALRNAMSMAVAAVAVAYAL